MSIIVANMLRVLPNRTVMIPGCEPPSAVSSLRFSAWYQHNGCDGGLVDVDLVLVAIPGSEIVIGVNYGVGNLRQQWLKLPGRSDDCPCPTNIDYYGIMKKLPKYKVEEPVPNCDLETADWCMSCGGKGGDCSGGCGGLPIAPDPYVKMGQQSGVQSLAQIPPYMID